MEYVNEFKYLGTLVTSRNEIEKEIKTRIASANRCYFSLIKFFKKRSISRKTKIRMYTTIVRPVVLYGCEAWALSQTLEKRLLVFENSVLRRIIGPVFDQETQNWRRRHNEELREITVVPLITNILKSRRMRWAGHVKRMDDRRYPKIILEGGVGGRRRRGRPRTRWNDCIEKNVKELTDSEETWQEIADHRPRWRGLCKAAMGHVT